MQIIDIDIQELERARRGGRARSAETLQLIESIEALGKDEARGIAITDQLTERKVRARLAYAARLAGRRLTIASDGEKVMFTLAERQRRRRRRRVQG